MARYGPDVWALFIYTGFHTTELVLRRKEQRQLWAHAYPVSPVLSLRAQRGNLVKATDAATGTRSPRRCAPRDDKQGTREQLWGVDAYLHDDGLNRLAARFAREGVAVAAGWRGVVSVPDVTQVRPDLLAPVVAGPHGGRYHFLEYERFGRPGRMENKLRPLPADD